ncbi:hypothetical protein B0H13DRAFT_1898984 [Mycena leptocephala]|nr:hypothetical protein B0H13DRAFT_1898984 [Mycena leptocephala]
MHSGQNQDEREPKPKPKPEGKIFNPPVTSLQDRTQKSDYLGLKTKSRTYREGTGVQRFESDMQMYMLASWVSLHSVRVARKSFESSIEDTHWAGDRYKAICAHVLDWESRNGGRHAHGYGLDPVDGGRQGQLKMYWEPRAGAVEAQIVHGISAEGATRRMQMSRVLVRAWPADTAAGGANSESVLDETKSRTDFLEERAPLRWIAEVVEENRLRVAVTGA